MNVTRIAASAAAIILVSTAAASASPTPRSDFVLPNVISVDTASHTGVFPIHKGSSHGKSVWFIVTDASDASVAKRLGAVFAPSLAGIGGAATQHASASYAFDGAPDFSGSRTYVASAGGFPPKSATPGGAGDARYSPYVHVDGIPGVINAPIIATGDSGFDVTTHTNTEDRVVAIDTSKETATLALARGFVNDRPVYYISTETSDAGASSIERATFVPKLAKAAPGSFIPIGVVVDGSNQGLAYLATQTPLGEDATLANAARIGSPFNVLSLAPSLSHPYSASGFSPLWNALFVKAKQHQRLTNYAGVAALASPVGILVNCPVVAYDDSPR
ncbi:MAG: hypothetical protein M3N13_05545 [Candidatus Eremiobacteraeota bacterium]|nr:hypothetical protein [Candidatus Eremiobacteraeota bacterium]